MPRRERSLPLLLLLGALVAALPPSATAPCVPSGACAERVFAVANAAGYEDVKVEPKRPEDAILNVVPEAEEQGSAISSQKSTVSIPEVVRRLAEEHTTHGEQHPTNAGPRAEVDTRRRRATGATDAVTDEQRIAVSKKLVEAAFGGRIDDMRQLLAQGAGVAFRNQEGLTALHWAAMNDQSEALQVLIDRGAAVDAGDNYGRTPLHAAASTQCVACVEALLAARANVDVRDRWGSTPLHMAARYDQDGAVRVLAAAGADTTVRDDTGKTAADLARSDVISSGLRSAAAQTSEKRAALSEALLEATKHGRVEEMQRLIGEGANVQCKDVHGFSALEWAAHNGHLEPLQLLISSGAALGQVDNDGSTALHWAAWSGHEHCVEALVAAGADLDARDARGRTALHDAAANGAETAVRALLAAGADPSVRDNKGKTAEDLAKSDTVRGLLLGDAATTAPALASSPQPTPFSLATSSPASAKLTEEERKAVSEKLLEAANAGRVEEMHRLIGQGADVGYSSERGHTALHNVAWHCHADALRLLLDRGAAVDATTSPSRCTPLHLAASRGHTPCVEALAAAGSPVDARDEFGWTPLHYAASHQKPETVRALLALGTDPGLRSNKGQTARDVATSEAVRALLTP